MWVIPLASSDLVPTKIGNTFKVDIFNYKIDAAQIIGTNHKHRHSEFTRLEYFEDTTETSCAEPLLRRTLTLSLLQTATF